MTVRTTKANLKNVRGRLFTALTTRSGGALVGEMDQVRHRLAIPIAELARRNSCYYNIVVQTILCVKSV